MPAGEGGFFRLGEDEKELPSASSRRPIFLEKHKECPEYRHVLQKCDLLSGFFCRIRRLPEGMHREADRDEENNKENNGNGRIHIKENAETPEEKQDAGTVYRDARHRDPVHSCVGRIVGMFLEVQDALIDEIPAEDDLTEDVDSCNGVFWCHGGILSPKRENSSPWYLSFLEWSLFQSVTLKSGFSSLPFSRGFLSHFFLT